MLMGWWNGIMDWFSSANPYEAANQTRHRPTKAGRVSHAQDEDSAVQPYGREQLRLECRDLRRNNPIVRAVADRLINYTVGRGIEPQAKTSDTKWNQEAELYWRNWSRLCDYRRRVTLSDFQKMLVDADLTDGELGIVYMADGRIAPVEAERIRDPKPYEPTGGTRLVDGVLVGNSGAALRYFVHNRNQRGFFDGTSWQSYSVNDMRLIGNTPFRADQVRSLPQLAPAVNPIKDLMRYINAMVLKAENEAQQFYVVKRDGGGVPVSANPRRYGKNADGTGTASTENGSPLERVGIGEIHHLRIGEELQRIANDSPNSQFSPFVQQVLRIVCSAIGLPYEVVVMDFSQSNYSVSRTALLTTLNTIEAGQDFVIQKFLQPIWNWRIAKAIKAGELRPAPVDEYGISEWYKVRWQTPRYTWIDPQKDASGAMMEISGGVSTSSEWSRKRGRDLEDVLSEKADDILLAHQMADKVREKYPLSGVTWRDFINVSQPGQQTQDNPPAEAVAKEAISNEQNA